MSTPSTNSERGHWLLAKMGKKVLRPGGRELTEKLIDQLHINREDSVVEFAPGMGLTASSLIAKNPKSYTGIELNEAAAKRLQKSLDNARYKVVNTTAAKTGLDPDSTDKVMGEAMLTMQADHRKAEIIREAHRILNKGGLYAIHELGLVPDTISSETKAEIQKKLAKTMKVNARPLAKKEWAELLEKEGFSIKEVISTPMHLLEPDRMINDEGVLNALKIGFNVMTHKKAKHMILGMRQVFREYADQITAFGIIAEKK